MLRQMVKPLRLLLYVKVKYDIPMHCFNFLLNGYLIGDVMFKKILIPTDNTYEGISITIVFPHKHPCLHT